MPTKTGFAGFSRECVRFYTDLAANNNREWFAEHKTDFNTYVMAPARDFVFEMGIALKELSPGIVADPRPDKSIFRYYRDTRFSKDKSPFKTHLGIFFWEGNRPKMECPGFYFHLEPPNLFLAAGLYCFTKELLAEYRDSVVDPRYGAQLTVAVKEIEARPGYELGGRHYKKTPRGYDPGHENARLLLHSGLWAEVSEAIPPEFYTPQVIKYCFERFKNMAPIFEWLKDMIGRVKG